DARIGDVAVLIDDRFDDDDPLDARLPCNFRVLRIDAPRGNGRLHVAADAHRPIARAADLAAELPAQLTADDPSHHAAHDATDHAADLSAHHAPLLAPRVDTPGGPRHLARHRGPPSALRHH